MAQSSGRVEYLAPATFTAAGHRYRIEDKRLFFDGGSAVFDFFIDRTPRAELIFVSTTDTCSSCPLPGIRGNRHGMLRLDMKMTRKSVSPGQSTPVASGAIPVAYGPFWARRIDTATRRF